MNVTASANMTRGATIQFITMASPSAFLSRMASGSSSKRTLQKAGYIIRISPTAMGMLVAPAVNRPMNVGMAGINAPAATPTAMARKIHRVR